MTNELGFDEDNIFFDGINYYTLSVYQEGDFIVQIRNDIKTDQPNITIEK